MIARNFSVRSSKAVRQGKLESRVIERFHQSELVAREDIGRPGILVVVSDAVAFDIGTGKCVIVGTESRCHRAELRVKIGGVHPQMPDGFLPLSALQEATPSSTD